MIIFSVLSLIAIATYESDCTHYLHSFVPLEIAKWTFQKIRRRDANLFLFMLPRCVAVLFIRGLHAESLQTAAVQYAKKAEMRPKPQSVAGATLRIVICRDTPSAEKIKKTGAQAEEPSLRFKGVTGNLQQADLRPG
jgi:hypothetical protein